MYSIRCVDLCKLVNDQVHLQNRNNNKKYCQYPLAFPWVLTCQGDHLLIALIHSFDQKHSPSARATNKIRGLILHSTTASPKRVFLYSLCMHYKIICLYKKILYNPCFNAIQSFTRYMFVLYQLWYIQYQGGCVDMSP